MASSESFFRRLSRLFRSGVSLRRKIKGYDVKAFYDKEVVHNNYGYGPFPFKREQSPFSVLGAYGLLDRLSRYAEFSEMEYYPEIATALDIMADETCSGDEKGKSFHIYSDNQDIKHALEELFYDVVNIEFNLRPWVRNLVKYGDFFCYTEVAPDIGVINVMPLPVNEMEREEGFDPTDPYAVRFKWISRGQKVLENWQVMHIRLLGNDLFIPYGTSRLEGARRVWRQLIMLEDAMLTYRIVRSPERRVFYVDVSNVSPTDVPNYMEQVKSSMRSNSAMDRTNGRQDYRYNPVAIDDDYFIPTRGDKTSTKIESLAGGQHVSAVEDVEFIHKKLVSALQIPAAYLGYEDAIGSKATLSQQDIRFSRTINILQKTVIAELNKLAILHLYSKGFDGEDLINFELKLSNPSSIALQQKLQLWKTKFEIADSAKGTEIVDLDFIRKEILGFTPEEIKYLQQGIERDKMMTLALDSLKLPEQETADSDTNVDPFDPSNYKVPGSVGGENSNQNSQTAYEKELLLNPTGEKKFSQTTGEEGEEEESLKTYKNKQLKLSSPPVKASPYVQKQRRRDRRKITDGASSTSMPDFAKMFSPKNQSLKDVYDEDFLNKTLLEDYIESLKIKPEKPRIDEYTKGILEKLKLAGKGPSTKKDIIIESAMKEFQNEKKLLEEPNSKLLEDLGITQSKNKDPKETP